MRSAMRAASQLPGRGPTDVDVAPCTCMLIRNTTMMMMMMCGILNHSAWQGLNSQPELQIILRGNDRFPGKVVVMIVFFPF